jgi:hypothetical protein
MAQSMPRNAARAQPPARGLPPRARVLVTLLLPLLILAMPLLGADEPLPDRPAGLSPASSVAMALELALLAQGDWASIPGSLDEARSLLQQPQARADVVRQLALEAAGRWSGRSEAARRLYAAWARMERADERSTMLDDPGAVGQLARMGLLAEFCAALEGSTHLPPSQTAGLLARSAHTRGAVDALERVGQALERLEPTTLLGAHHVAAWRGLLSEARVPGPLSGALLPTAQGQPVERPTAPLVQVAPEQLTIASRSLVSWRDGRLEVDHGPPAERLAQISPDAWERWQGISRRRGELALGGITALAPPSAHRDTAPIPPNIVADPDLPVRRLVQLMGVLEPLGVTELCLLVRPAEPEQPRQVCAPFARVVPDGAAIWRLGPGGLHATDLPNSGAPAWAVPEPDARIEDLVLALEEARHAQRPLGVAAD